MTTEHKRMIFHHPGELADARGISGTSLRPSQMATAFSSLGYDVFFITGSTKQRAASLRKLKREIHAGRRFDFMYSESPGFPSALSDDDHFPRRPLIDARIFGFISRARIPQSVFYRDIYWRFPHVSTVRENLVGLATYMFYLFDLRVYARFSDIVYLPSIRMATHLPELGASNVRGLPPGSDIAPSAPPKSPRLTVLYVGGLGHFYDISTFFEAARQCPNVNFVLCTREADWERFTKSFHDTISSNIRIVHESGDQIAKLYEAADVFYMHFGANEYRRFAAPLKYYESLRAGRPTITSPGSLVADEVARNGAGWVTPHSTTALVELLQDVDEDRSVLTAAQDAAARAGADITWIARAEQVARDMKDSCALRSDS